MGGNRVKPTLIDNIKLFYGFEGFYHIDLLELLVKNYIDKH